MGDKLEMRIKWDNDGVECFNVLHYEASTSGGDVAAGLIAAFNDDVRAAWLDCLHNTCKLKEIDVINLDDPTDFSTGVYDLAGTGNTTAGGNLPTFVAVQLRKVSPTRTIRSGWIRVRGAPEGFVTGNTVSAAGTAEFNPLAAALPVINDPGAGGAQYDLQIRSKQQGGVENEIFQEVDTVQVYGVSHQISSKT